MLFRSGWFVSGNEVNKIMKVLKREFAPHRSCDDDFIHNTGGSTHIIHTRNGSKKPTKLISLLSLRVNVSLRTQKVYLQHNR